MDTRAKIIGVERAAELGPADTVVVVGYFDPVTALHARRLREIRGRFGRLIAVVLEPENPLLDAQSRAELVAALGCVDFVVIGPAALEGFQVVHEEAADEARRRDLIAQVAARHEAPAR